MKFGARTVRVTATSFFRDLTSKLAASPKLHHAIRSRALNIFSPQRSRVKAEFEKDLVNNNRGYNVIIYRNIINPKLKMADFLWSLCHGPKRLFCTSRFDTHVCQVSYI